MTLQTDFYFLHHESRWQSWLDGGDGEEGIIYFGVLRDSSAVTHQLLDGHPVI